MIGYEDKVDLYQNSDVPDINKVSASDMNEIKKSINETILTSLFGVGTDTWSPSGSYAIGDIVIYDCLLYKNLTGNNDEDTAPSVDITNWEEISILA